MLNLPHIQGILQHCMGQVATVTNIESYSFIKTFLSYITLYIYKETTLLTTHRLLTQETKQIEMKE